MSVIEVLSEIRAGYPEARTDEGFARLVGISQQAVWSWFAGETLPGRPGLIGLRRLATPEQFTRLMDALDRAGSRAALSI